MPRTGMGKSYGDNAVKQREAFAAENPDYKADPSVSGAGALSGGMTGFQAGSAAGPFGAIAGALIGAVLGAGSAERSAQSAFKEQEKAEKLAEEEMRAAERDAQAVARSSGTKPLPKSAMYLDSSPYGTTQPDPMMTAWDAYKGV